MAKNTESTEKTEQLLLRPRESLLERLMAATEEHDRGKSHNQVALEILDDYLDFWIERKELDRAVYEEQRARVLGKEPAPATTPRRARKVA